MGDSMTQAALSGKPTGAWMAYQAAFLKLVEETVQTALEKTSPKEGREAVGAPQAPEIKKTVADTVSAVLLETNILEKLVERQVKAQIASGAGGIAGREGLDSIRQDAIKGVRDFLSRNIETLFQNEIRSIIQKEVMNFLASDQLKELMDEKFRMINTYLKTDVIPKIVQQELSRAES